MSNALELARWQFALTTLYHFTFVPLTMGLAPILAIMQTRWYRTRDDRWMCLTRFFAVLFVINFAIGGSSAPDGARRLPRAMRTNKGPHDAVAQP